MCIRDRGLATPMENKFMFFNKTKTPPFSPLQLSVAGTFDEQMGRTVPLPTFPDFPNLGAIPSKFTKILVLYVI